MGEESGSLRPPVVVSSSDEGVLSVLVGTTCSVGFHWRGCSVDGVGLGRKLREVRASVPPRPDILPRLGGLERPVRLPGRERLMGDDTSECATLHLTAWATERICGSELTIRTSLLSSRARACSSF